MSIFDRFSKKKPETEKKEASKKADVKAEPKKTQPAKSAPEDKKSKTPKESGRKVGKTVRADTIIVKPIITEKATSLSPFGQYVFEVPVNANRIEVARAIQTIYGVTPIKVNIMNVSGRDVTYGRSQGRTKNWKKAVITLKEGESITIQDGV